MEIIVEHKEGVCFITFNRPEVFNAFNKPMAMAVQNTLDACEKDDTVRAVVLIGTGKAFAQDKIWLRLQIQRDLH